jgi:hypothetical protein
MGMNTVVRTAHPSPPPGEGSADMTLSPAMPRETAELGIRYGMAIARDLKHQGYELLATGEMGIGNTTSSSAMAAVLLGQPAQRMTGVGAGLSGEGLRRKISAIEKAVALNRPDPADPVDVLAKVGGFDIAGPGGVCTWAGELPHPHLIDGFIAKRGGRYAPAHLPAEGLHAGPPTARASPPGGCSGQPGYGSLPTAGMRWAGHPEAVAAMPLLAMVLAVYNTMAAFEDIKLEAYQPLRRNRSDCSAGAGHRLCHGRLLGDPGGLPRRLACIMGTAHLRAGKKACGPFSLDGGGEFGAASWCGRRVPARVSFILAFFLKRVAGWSIRYCAGAESLWWRPMPGLPQSAGREHEVYDAWPPRDLPRGRKWSPTSWARTPTPSRGGVTKAAVETWRRKTADGVMRPMFSGHRPARRWVSPQAVNTKDSMVG